MKPYGRHKLVDSYQRIDRENVTKEYSVNSKSVEVVTYNPQWREIFQVEAEKIKQALGDNCVDVLHIGSTSIPGLAAKPIIDLIPVVKDIAAVDELSLIEIGYRSRGELGMMFRRFFQKIGPDEKFHVHMWEQGHAEIEKHLLFRQHLIDHSVDLKAYEKLKQNLAAAFKDDRTTYTLRKDSFIKGILDKSGFKGKLIVQALTLAEWEAYHRIRKEQIFDGLGIVYDPHHPSITAENNYHFVMSVGTNIVGVAHIQLLEEHNIALLRPFAIDGAYQRQGYGTWFLNQIERWLSQQGRRFLHLHSDPEAVSFYKRLGYVEMVFPYAEPAADYDTVDLGKDLTEI
jgi:GrpB-like predicted nucleotidyltransferase (UPF0157 family)/GNAT superfamily N-acetyltransferase